MKCKGEQDMGANRKKIVVFVSTNDEGLLDPAHGEIPQIDVSMHHPDYPGSHAPLFGRRLVSRDSHEKYSGYRAVDFLFRARSFAEALRLAVQLQPRGWQPEELRPWFVEAPYPIQTFPLNHISRKHYLSGCNTLPQDPQELMVEEALAYLAGHQRKQGIPSLAAS